MGEAQGKRFRINARNMEAGAVHEDVEKVQRFLSRFGYLAGAYEPRRVDQPTQDALRVFQTRMRIAPSGVIDEETADAIELPRCGVPDVPTQGRAASGVSADFVLRGCDYEAKFRTLSFAFLNGTADIPGTG